MDRLSECEGEFGDPCNGFWIVSVDGEDRCLNHACHVGRVDAGAAVLGRRSEADLVVDHDVDRAAGAVALKLRQVQSLGHNTLPGEGSIAVHQHGQNVGASFLGQEILLGAHDPFKNGVDGFEV